MLKIALRALALTLALGAVTAAPALAAYTIILKDGSRLVAKDRYTVTDGKAYFTLQNGTRSFIDASQIDDAATRKANEDDYGSAVIIDSGEERRSLPVQVQEEKQQQRERGLSEYISQRREGLGRPDAEEETAAARPAPGAPSQRLPGGWPDLGRLPRESFASSEVAGELETFLRGQGLQGARVFQGTSSSHVFVEMATSSEASVFRGIRVASSALLELRERYGDQITALELLMLTPTQERGGQFLLTPEMAEDVVAERVTMSRFFVENVQF